MNRKSLFLAFCVTIAAVMTMPVSMAASAGDVEYSETAAVEETAFVTVETSRASGSSTVPALRTEEHAKFMNGTGGGMFQPDRILTRAEVVQMVYNLLLETPQAEAPYSDVKGDEWFAQALGTVWSVGLLHEGADEAFRPNDNITRAEFADILGNFVPESGTANTFPDVSEDYWAYRAIEDTTAYGLFTGYTDGTFGPDNTLSRAEAAAAFDRLLGRAADETAITSTAKVRFFPDVPTTYWAYDYIMEATVTHEYEIVDGQERWTSAEAERVSLSDGYYTINDRLYRVQDGFFLRSTVLDMMEYDENGRYTTGSDWLDAKLQQIVNSCTDSSMTRDQKLRALYNYVRDNFSYIKRSSYSGTGWEATAAEKFLRDGKGNCFGYAATFCLLTRQIGVSSWTVIGHVKLPKVSSPIAHCWVESTLDGTNYIFDTQSEWRYRYTYNCNYNLFKTTTAVSAPFYYYYY